MSVDYPDYATPQAHATAIAGTGAPLLVLSSTVYTSGNKTLVAGGAGQPLANAPVSQIGYEIQVSVQENAAGTGGYLQVTLTWNDSASGLVVGVRNYYVATGTQGNPHIVTGTGFTRGDRLTVNVANSDSVAVTYSITILQNSRVYQGDLWLTYSMPVIAGFTLPDFTDLPSGILAQVSVSLTTGQGKPYILPLYTGMVRIHFESGSNTTDAEAQVFPIADQQSTPIYDHFTETGQTGNANDVLVLPNAQCHLSLTNHNAATQTLRASVIAAAG